jgi:DNA polymerase III delta prime subunit
MKFYESHFEEYLNSNAAVDLHLKLEKVYENVPADIHDLKNLIFYGPSGVGKYTQMLKFLKRYSPSELKYEKKMSITYNKEQFFFKISDIHYELDMSLLGCNSKLLWHDIYQQILDSISAKPGKSGIITCLYFHEIHGELLENFYSYMQKNNTSSIHVAFILVTDHISFIPDNILNCCEIIYVEKPSKAMYKKCVQSQDASNKIPTALNVCDITNIKNLHSRNTILMHPHKIICDKILQTLKNVAEVKFIKIRDMLYDLLIYNIDIGESVWYILTEIVKQKMISDEKMGEVLIKTYIFFQYYNNNYRPIYHLENYFFYLMKEINFP